MNSTTYADEVNAKTWEYFAFNTGHPLWLEAWADLQIAYEEQRPIATRFRLYAQAVKQEPSGKTLTRSLS